MGRTLQLSDWTKDDLSNVIVFGIRGNCRGLMIDGACTMKNPQVSKADLESGELFGSRDGGMIARRMTSSASFREGKLGRSEFLLRPSESAMWILRELGKSKFLVQYSIQFSESFMWNLAMESLEL